MTNGPNTGQTILDQAGLANVGHKKIDSINCKKSVVDNKSKSDEGDGSSEFYQQVIACIRALSNDKTLSVTIGEENATELCDVNLPLIESESNKSLTVLIRGLGDSFAMMRLHHDVQLHNRLAPEDPVADRLFTILERERFESVGADQFLGVARNLNRVWTLSHGADALARFGPAEQLEFVLSCLCREKLNNREVPVTAVKFIQPIRGPVEDLLGDSFLKLAQNAHSQISFAEQALSIIGQLGFDTSPRVLEQTLEDTSNPESNDESQTQSQTADDSNSDDETVEESTETKPEVDDSAELSDQAELVRNAEVSPENEEELEDPDENMIVETAGLESANLPNKLATNYYSVYDKSDDEVCRADSLIDRQRLKSFRKDLDIHLKHYEPMIGLLAARLQKVLLSKQKRAWQQDHDEGELDPNRLTQLIVNPESSLTYRVQSDSLVRDTAVCLLIDNSRSMFGKPIATAACCADLITRVLERCGVSTEVLGFTTVTMYGGPMSDLWQAQGRPADVGRLNNVRHIIYKSASDSWRRSQDNFGLMLDKELLKQNIDGEALMWAQHRLLKRPEKRRIMIVISDGIPSDSYTLKANHKHYLRDHLDHVVAQIERRSAIELVAIGIGHQMSHHYRRSFNIDDVENLGPLLLSELTRLLRH